MAISKEKKASIIAGLKEVLAKAKSVVFVNFRGLKVSDANSLRRQLREKEVGYTVAKKTLIRRALEGTGWAGQAPELEGEIALAYGSDSLAPAKGVYRFSQQVKDNLKIVGGVFEGKYMEAEMMLELARIPDRQELYGKLVFILNSPIQKIVMALDQIAKKQAV